MRKDEFPIVDKLVKDSINEELDEMASVKRLLKKSAENDEAEKPASDETKC